MTHRYICTVLDEMRNCVKTSNFSYLTGLIEEAQSQANRMESRLFEIKDFERLQEDVRLLKKEKKQLEKEKKDDVDS
jgi:hypothetical protein